MYNYNNKKNCQLFSGRHKKFQMTKPKIQMLNFKHRMFYYYSTTIQLKEIYDSLKYD